MTKPVSYDIVYAERNEHTKMLDVWVEADGVVLAFGFPFRAFRDRRLIYGHAHIEQDVDADDNPVGEPRYVKDGSVSTDDILDILIAEHFDRFESKGEDWRANKWERKPKRTPGHKTRVRGLERSNVKLNRAPERKDVRIVKTKGKH